MIIAKPIIENQYWILNDESGKIGQIESVDNEFVVKINGNKQTFSNIKTIQTRTGIQFKTVDQHLHQTTAENQVHGFPTDCNVYNPVYDAHLRVPLYTKTAKSKSLYAAGYYKLKQGAEWETVFCPKFILLQRYEYFGPVRSINDFNHV
jgi:hypothetical protein